jgi:hypothetical protein
MFATRPLRTPNSTPTKKQKLKWISNDRREGFELVRRLRRKKRYKLKRHPRTYLFGGVIRFGENAANGESREFLEPVEGQQMHTDRRAPLGKLAAGTDAAEKFQ